MACTTYRFLTWNINGLRARFTDLHSYVITQKPDVIALQEVGPEVPQLRGYVNHSLGPGDGSSRGLTTYVKHGLPFTFHEMGLRGVWSFLLCVCMFLMVPCIV